MPYPLGSNAKGYDGPHRRSECRMEGEGDLLDVRDRAPFPTETGKGTTSKVLTVQVRPESLAK